MPRNGAGSATRVNPPGSVGYAPGTTIKSEEANAEFTDVYDLLTKSLASDGQTTPTANLPMGGFKHTGCAEASSTNEYVTLGQANTAYLSASAAALAYVAKDGSSAMGGNLNMSANKITNLLAGTDPTDAATVGQVQTASGQFVPLVGNPADPMSGNLNLGTYKVVNVGNATDGTDALNRNYADTRYTRTSVANTWTAAQAFSGGVSISGADLNMGNRKITAVANAVASTDALPYGQAASLFLTQTGASSQYLTQSAAASTYATASSVSGSYAPKSYPSFTGDVAATGAYVGTSAIVNAGYTLPLDGSTGIVFLQASPAGIAAGTTSLNFAAPDVTGAACNFVKNRGGTVTYIPIGASAFTVSSERRLKNIIEGLSDALARLSAINPVIYALKSDPDQRREVGLIAEDVETVLPEAVRPMDDHKGIDYGRLSVLALACCKELLARVEALENAA